MKDQRAFIIPGPEMDGLWDREFTGSGIGANPHNCCPQTGFTEARNIRFFPWGFKTRQGYTTAFTNPGAVLIQVLSYATNDPVTGNIITGDITVDANGNVYDSASPTPLVAIDGVGSGNYVNIITIFTKLFITKHNLNTGTNTFVGIYTPGSGVPPSASGGLSPAIGAGVFASSGTAGNVTQGLHVFGVIAETASGHLSKIQSGSPFPTFNTVAAFNIANANQQVTGTGLPLGPPGTVRRHIIASRVITGYTGNPDDYEVFFVDGAIINDNVTTTITFNFTDESLLNSADYLYDIISSLPSGLGFVWYSNRLITWGEQYPGPLGTGEQIGPSVLRISEPGKPQTFFAIDGVLEVFKDDGQFGIKNVFEQDGLLVICKETKTYVTRDNGGAPNTWQVSTVDNSVGSTVFGVTKTLDTTGASKSGKTIVVGEPGIFLFQGMYIERALTWKIEKLWQNLATSVNFNKFVILDVPQAKTFLVRVNDGSTSYLLVADYSLGLDWKGIRWSIWTLAGPPTFLTLKDPNTVYFSSVGVVIFKMFFGSNNDYTNTNDNGSNIDPCALTTAELRLDNELNKYKFTVMKMRGLAADVTEIGIQVFAGDDVLNTGQVNGLPVPTWTPQSFDIVSSPQSPEILKANISIDGYYLRIRFLWTGQNFEVRHLVFFGNVDAEDKEAIV